jgi:hypothetical protein
VQAGKFEQGLVGRRKQLRRNFHRALISKFRRLVFINYSYEIGRRLKAIRLFV